jgi:hypothetical protein
MNVVDFNNKILQYEPIKIPTIKQYLSANTNSDEVYRVCRQMYQLIYDGLTKDDSGAFAIFIPDDRIEQLGHSLKIVADKIASNSAVRHLEVLIELIESVRLFYYDTASKEEVESRTYVEHNNDPTTAGTGLFGKFYTFNLVPNWKEFEERLLSLM